MKYIYIPTILMAIILFSCVREEQKDIIVLTKFVDKSYSEMLKILGPPADKTGYTIKNAPTKSWNHTELFSKYPKTPENENIHIMEVTWDDNEFLIFACFHIVDGENRCLVAKKIRKGLQF
jgi:hypothetical protein